MNQDIRSIVDGPLFDTITLQELNDVAELMDREERKYAVHINQLPSVLSSLSKDFRLLEHVEKRIFRYESLYFDDDYATYLAHHKGIRRRFKVRTRFYVDSDICAFEMKVKKYRGCTDKRRIPYSTEHREVVTEEAYLFIKKFFQESYGKSFDYELRPELNVINDRITLVAKNGSERLTIDMNMIFKNHQSEYKASENFVIIETKTPNAYGLCDRILRKHHIRPQRYCSKYCLGVALLHLSEKEALFRSVLKVMDRIGEGIVIPITKEV